MNTTFAGAAKRLDDLDLPKLGALIGVGEDEIHAFLDVETRGHGFDDEGRPIILRATCFLIEAARVCKKLYIEVPLEHTKKLNRAIRGGWAYAATLFPG